MALNFTASKFHATNAAGKDLAGGKVYTYTAGTLTPQATYTTAALDVPNTNPVILDSTGRASIWLDPDLSYKFTVTTAADVAAPDGTVDNISVHQDFNYIDAPIIRANRLVIGFDEDTDVSNNASALQNNSCLNRYSTAYANKLTKNAIHVQRYVKADFGERASGFKAAIITGAEGDTDTPAIGSYQPEWGVNVEIDTYSTLDTNGVTVGLSSTVRRFSEQGVIGAHINAMDMRVPTTANSLGGITGIEAHSDAIGPDHRQGNHSHGYRTTIRCAARTQQTQPTWDKRGSGAMTNGATVALDAICLPKNATVSTSYIGPYFVCTTGGTLGGTDTVLDATTTPLATVADGTATWECRIGTEVGMGLLVRNGSDLGGSEKPGYYRYGIVVSNAADLNNVNQIGTGIQVENSGTVNYHSVGTPARHADFENTTGESVIRLRTGDSANDSAISSIEHAALNALGVTKTFANFTTTLVDNTAGAEQGRVTLAAIVAGIGTPHLYLENGNTIIGKKAVLAAASVDGFLHIPQLDGNPSGVPTLYIGKSPIGIVPSTNRLYAYYGGAWHYTTMT